jgi:hypothetical protein
MPIIQQPSVNTIQSVAGAQYVVAFSYDWFGDEPVQQVVTPFSPFLGSKYSLNVLGLKVPATIPAIQSALISIEYIAPEVYGPGSGVPDGDLYIVGTSLSQVIRLPAPALQYPTGLVPPQSKPDTIVRTCVLPVVASNNTVLNFIKGINENASAMFGSMSVSLYTFPQAPYVIEGYSNF